MLLMMGHFMGTPVTQNAQGDLLGYVQNIGDKNDKMTRVYQTNAYLPYHGDLSDVVGLLCIRKAKEGGLSSLVSTASVYSQLPRPKGTELVKASWVDQGKRLLLSRSVNNRSFRPTLECFFSSRLWKDRIMQAQGKTPKVLFAARAGAGC